MTASRIVFEGTVPMFSELPPSTRRRSMRQTRLRSFAAWMAAFCPAGPEPTTARSAKAPAGEREEKRGGRKLPQGVALGPADPPRAPVPRPPLEHGDHHHV